MPPIVYLILNRSRPSVQTRSPKIVIAGLLFMLFDCILNTFLMTQSPHQTSPWAFNCDLGIFVIVVCFFGSMFAYGARMWRVKKVFVLYQTYLECQLTLYDSELNVDEALAESKAIDRNQSFDRFYADEPNKRMSLEHSGSFHADQQPRRSSIVNDMEMSLDQKYLQQINQLQEEKILRKVGLFLVPGCVLGFLGFFFPLFYSILPVHEADVCLCQFYSNKLEHDRHYPALSYDDIGILAGINVYSYYFVEFSFMVGLIYLAYQIRHINDDTKIKVESVMIVAWWLFLGLVNQILFTLLASSRCNSDQNFSVLATINLSYTCIMLRNIVTCFITMYFQHQVNTECNIDMKVMTGGQNIN